MASQNALKIAGNVGSDTVVVGTRLPASVVARLDEEVVNLMEAFPGLEFSRSDFVKMALQQFLDDGKFRIKIRNRVREGK